MNSFNERFPCGCRLEADARGWIHMYPCDDDCPMIDALGKVVAEQFPRALSIDLRPMEEALGREVSIREVEAALQDLRERN